MCLDLFWHGLPAIVRRNFIIVLSLGYVMFLRPKVENQTKNAQPEKINFLDAESSVPKYVSILIPKYSLRKIGSSSRYFC